MPFIAGPRDNPRGEPSRTLCRILLLTALHEAEPRIVDELRETCGEPAARVLATAGPHDHPRHLLRLTSLYDWHAAVASAEAAIAQAGSSPVRERLRLRAVARGDLLDALIEWGTMGNLTDEDGRSNAWILQHALDVLRGREWGSLTAGVLEATQPAKSFRKRHHAPTSDPASPLGPLARDFVWLVRYALTREDRPDFAPDASHDLILRRVQSAADRAGFHLPDPIRPDRESLLSQ
jgi:hypothetical protein